MPYSEPVKPGDTVETVRRIARIAQLILDLRAEYERRPKADTLIQIKERAAELQAMAADIEVLIPAPDVSKNSPAK